MKKLLSFFHAHLLVLFTFAVVACFSFADGLEDPVDTMEFLKAIMEFVASPKGAVIAVAAAVAQLVLLFFRTQLASFVGAARLAIVYSINVVVVVLGGLAAGMPLVESLLLAVTSGAIQNAVHQWIKHLSPPKLAAVK